MPFVSSRWGTFSPQPLQVQTKIAVTGNGATTNGGFHVGTSVLRTGTFPKSSAITTKTLR
jgi:hypothetical protein